MMPYDVLEAASSCTGVGGAWSKLGDLDCARSSCCIDVALPVSEMIGEGGCMRNGCTVVLKFGRAELLRCLCSRGSRADVVCWIRDERGSIMTC